jgi:hypothetical protein
MGVTEPGTKRLMYIEEEVVFQVWYMAKWSRVVSFA